jgi:hypothetical protein
MKQDEETRHVKDCSARGMKYFLRSSFSQAIIVYFGLGENYFFIRLGLTHSHGDFTDAITFTMDSELQTYLREQLTINSRHSTITLRPLIQKFRASKGYEKALLNSSWNPSSGAIKNFILRFKIKLRHHTNDFLSTKKICEIWLTEHKEDFLHCEMIDSTEFILVGQTSHQKRMMERFSEPAVGIDSTHSTNAYGLPLTYLVARDCFSKTQVIAFFISQSDGERDLVRALKILQERNPTFYPHHFIMDKSTAEINTITKVFSQSKILLCQTHTRTALLRELKDPAKRIDPEHVVYLYAWLTIRIEEAKDRATFDQEVDLFLSCNFVTPEFRHYFEDHWLNCIDRWAMHARGKYYARMNTNNMVESFNKTTKTILGASHRNFKKSRIDDMLQTLLFEILPIPYNHYARQHAEEMRKLTLRKDNFQQFTSVHANQLSSSQERSLSILPSEVHVGSENIYKVRGYEVDLLHVKCTCPYFIGWHLPCKHIFICLRISGLLVLSHMSDSNVRVGRSVDFTKCLEQPQLFMLDREHIAVSKESHGGIMSSYITDNGVKVDHDDDENQGSVVREDGVPDIVEAQTKSAQQRVSPSFQEESDFDFFEGGGFDFSEGGGFDYSDLQAIDEAQEEISMTERKKISAEFRKNVEERLPTVINGRHRASDNATFMLMREFNNVCSELVPALQTTRLDIDSQYSIKRPRIETVQEEGSNHIYDVMLLIVMQQCLRFGREAANPRE